MDKSINHLQTKFYSFNLIQVIIIIFISSDFVYSQAVTVNSGWYLTSPESIPDDSGFRYNYQKRPSISIELNFGQFFKNKKKSRFGIRWYYYSLKGIPITPTNSVHNYSNMKEISYSYRVLAINYQRIIYSNSKYYCFLNLAPGVSKKNTDRYLYCDSAFCGFQYISWNLYVGINFLIKLNNIVGVQCSLFHNNIFNNKFFFEPFSSGSCIEFGIVLEPPKQKKIMR
jgi:hypothetical protein